jgi:hypothetical protein
MTNWKESNTPEQLVERRTSSAGQVVEIGEGLEQTPTFSYHLSSRRRRTRVPLVCGANRRSKLYYESNNHRATHEGNNHRATCGDASFVSMTNSKNGRGLEQTPTFSIALSSLTFPLSLCPPDEGGNSTARATHESNTPEHSYITTITCHSHHSLSLVLPTKEGTLPRDQLTRSTSGEAYFVSMTSSRNGRWIRTNSHILLSLVLPTKEGTPRREQQPQSN